MIQELELNWKKRCAGISLLGCRQTHRTSVHVYITCSITHH